MTNPLQSLVIDYWYKAVVVASIVFLLVALTVDLKGVDNKTVILISLGAFFIGLGEWINHPLQTRIAPGMKITSYNRSASLRGSLFDLLGFSIVCIGAYPLLY
ncbi:hypothetical protein [Herminiimonas aquatilis]|uniref:Uncharacterized protein n=1 Tax=Herminiimonas aquatilis TaxID=345342 RepID=A0ABW2J5E4_9BURK